MQRCCVSTAKGRPSCSASSHLEELKREIEEDDGEQEVEEDVHPPRDEPPALLLGEILQGRRTRHHNDEFRQPSHQLLQHISTRNHRRGMRVSACCNAHYANP